MIDFHCHLSRNEVIGLLAGLWHPQEKRLIVIEAFPSTRVEGNDEVNVEIDPIAELQIKEEATARGLKIVGWYHSHPLFEPEPSLRDVNNQKKLSTPFP